jgi:hypothetical protein
MTFLLTLAGLAGIMTLRKYKLSGICVTAIPGTAAAYRQPGANPPPRLEATDGAKPFNQKDCPQLLLE